MVPRGAPVPGQSEIFGRDVMSEMSKKARLERLVQPGRTIRAKDGKVYPVGRLSPRDVLIHDWVHERVAEAQKMQAHMLEAKLKDFEEFDLICDLIAEEFDTVVSGRRGGALFESIDGLWKVQITTTDRKEIGNAIVAAEELVRQVLDELTDGVSPDLRRIVDQAFVRNPQTGKISAARIVQLVNTPIEHPKWPSAQRALRAAIKKDGSRRYMRFYHRESVEQNWQLVDLNYSSLGA